MARSYGTPRGPHSGTFFEIYMADGNPMGIARGHYPLLISGYKFVTVEANVIALDLTVLFKASGNIPNTQRQKPNREDYGFNRRRGCQPDVVYYPIAHINFWQGTAHVVARMRREWELGRGVGFHCNQGEARAPAAAAPAPTPA